MKPWRNASNSPEITFLRKFNLENSVVPKRGDKHPRNGHKGEKREVSIVVHVVEENGMVTSLANVNRPSADVN